MSELPGRVHIFLFMLLNERTLRLPCTSYFLWIWTMALNHGLYKDSRTLRNLDSFSCLGLSFSRTLGLSSSDRISLLSPLSRCRRFDSDFVRILDCFSFSLFMILHDCYSLSYSFSNLFALVLVEPRTWTHRSPGRSCIVIWFSMHTLNFQHYHTRLGGHSCRRAERRSLLALASPRPLTVTTRCMLLSGI